MRYQNDPYSCGPAALVNALRSLGKKVSERAVRNFSSTTKEKGTDEHGIMAALRALGFDGYSFELDIDEEALKIAKKSKSGKPIIICTQNLQHWETIIGMSGNRFIVANPANTIRNMKEHGIHMLSEKQLLKLWEAKNGTHGRYYGILCHVKR